MADGGGLGFPPGRSVFGLQRKLGGERAKEERGERVRGLPLIHPGLGIARGSNGSTREGSASPWVATAGGERDDREGFVENPLEILLAFAE